MDRRPAHPQLPHGLDRPGRLRRLLPLVLGAALAGCATPHLPQLPRETPPGWQHAPADDAALGPAPDLHGWWKAFNDTELDRLVERALAGNLTLQQAALRIGAARSLDSRTYAEYLPEAGIRTFAEPVPDNSASYFQMGFDAKWEFGLFGRAQSHARVTAGELGVARSEAQAARVSVVAEVARTYVELRGAEQRLGLLEQARKLAQDKAELTATRQRLRLASANELAQTQAGQASAEAALYEPRLEIERCRQQLAVLLGLDHAGTDLVAAGAPPRLGSLRIASAPADLLRTRPEIRRAENEVLKAAGELGLAQADLYPRLGIGGSLTYAARVIGHTRLSDADGIVTIGPAIDIPLLDWGARQAVVDARDAALSASVLAYRQAVLEGVAEAETALATLQQQSERAAALARGIDGLASSAAATVTLGRLGLADGLDRTAADNALLQARLEAAQAEQARSIAFIALYKSLGGAPLPPPEPAAETGKGAS
ncbi:TolC family protein [Dokdonella ginsengisoli]|uniref:TolC family protein n=1 Tax=Dokdonella ginsengisoli TaxID=363846 RepID=A0ABV9QQL2_9GAMM